MYVEVRRDGEWERAGDVFTNPQFNPDKPTNEINSPKLNYYTWREKGFPGPLSSILSKIGVPGETREGWPIDADIADLPDLQDEDESDYFSQYWIGLKELLNFDWEQPSGIYDFFREEKTHREAVGRDFWTLVEEMKRLGNPRDVRILFEIYGS
jgi:hypothetical protein